jgi:hypothetical protein
VAAYVLPTSLAAAVLAELAVEGIAQANAEGAAGGATSESRQCGGGDRVDQQARLRGKVPW